MTPALYKNAIQLFVHICIPGGTIELAPLCYLQQGLPILLIHTVCMYYVCTYIKFQVKNWFSFYIFHMSNYSFIIVSITFVCKIKKFMIKGNIQTKVFVEQTFFKNIGLLFLCADSIQIQQICLKSTQRSRIVFLLVQILRFQILAQSMMFIYSRSVSDIILTCQYDKRMFIYTGGVGWERINVTYVFALERAPSQHHQCI